MNRWLERIIAVVIILFVINGLLLASEAFFLRVQGGRTEIYSWSLHETDVDETPSAWNNWHPRLTHEQAKAERARINDAYKAELWDDDRLLFLLQFVFVALVASCVIALNRRRGLVLQT